MTILAHDVAERQPARDSLAAQMAAWEAIHGKPVCHGPTVSAQAPTEIDKVMAEKRKAAHRKGHEASMSARRAKRGC